MIGWAVYCDTLQPNPALTAHAGADVRGRRRRRPTAASDRSTVAAVAGAAGRSGRWATWKARSCASAPRPAPTFAAVTTAVTCGSVNCMHDSLNPLAGLTPLTGMWLNCIFGGKGVGLINLLVYLIVGVFLAGLMVGRTPEYLGKKVEAREMKLAMLALLIHPILILVPTGLFAATRLGHEGDEQPRRRTASREILYEFSSASANNGSGFEGLGDTWGFNDPKDNPSPPAPYSPHWDIATGLVMLLGRFIPIIAPLALAGEPGGQEADAVHGRHAADRHAHVRLRAAGDDPAGRRAAVPAGGGARARWPSTWGRSRSAGESLRDAPACADARGSSARPELLQTCAMT